MVCPDTGKAVGLKLKSYRQFVGLYLVRTLLKRMHLVRYAQEVLYVVAYLVGYDICLGKLTRCMEAGFQVPKELEVDIDLVVPRAVKRTHGRLGKAAGGIDRVREEDQFRLFIGLAAAAEQLVPCVLRICKNDRY